MKVDYNPYEGRTVKGSPSVVVSGGEVIIDGDRFVGKKGAGRFLRRGPSQAPAGCRSQGRTQETPPHRATVRLFFTSNTPLISRAFRPATDLSLSLSTTPSSVTRPCFTMM